MQWHNAHCFRYSFISCGQNTSKPVMCNILQNYKKDIVSCIDHFNVVL